MYVTSKKTRNPIKPTIIAVYAHPGRVRFLFDSAGSTDPAAGLTAVPPGNASLDIEVSELK